MPNTDLDQLQGSWTVVSLELGGMSLPAGAFSNARVVVDGDRFESQAMGAVYAGTVKLDAATAPKHFDLKFTAGPESGNTNLGIYKLDGDTWTLCLNMKGETRPAEFVSGRQQALQVLKRAPVMSAVPPTAPKGEAIPEFEGEWQMTECVISGQKLPNSYLTGRRVVQGNHLMVTMGGQVILEATYGADRAATPKTLEYLLRNGSLQYGIWEFDGNTLRTCLGAIDKDRPTEFDSTKGDGRILTAWRKV